MSAKLPIQVERTYEELKVEVRRLQEEGRIDIWPSRDQRIDWAYGNTKIENESVTREMARDAVDRKPAKP